MKMKQLLVMAMSFLALATFAAVCSAGSLGPSAAPGPTMKTLDEVEPRIPIRQSDIPLTIDTPGSYYLVEDANSVDTAITINVNNVTIDLMGYSLTGANPGATIFGIYMLGRRNVEIRNGTIRNYYSGIYGYSNILSDDCLECRVINVRVESNTIYGILLADSGHLVKDCTLGGNGLFGIFVDSGSTVTGNVVYNTKKNLLGIGIRVINGCTVTGNTLFSNTEQGIFAGDGCTVIGNTSYNNTLGGILTGTSCSVSNNTIYNNQGKGIEVGYGCVVKNNSVRDNQDVGIKGDGTLTVSGNTVYSNVNYGIDVGSSCSVIGNSVSNNNGTGVQAGFGSTVSNNTVSYNNVRGMFVSSGCLVSNNSIFYNNQSDTPFHAGINVSSDCYVKNNLLDGNKQYNIYVDFNKNVIEENVLLNSDYGIYVRTGIPTPFGGNFYTNNRATGNVTDYFVATPENTDGGGNISF